MAKVPDTEVAALYAVAPAAAVVLSPACKAVMVQLPVLLRVTIAEETPRAAPCAVFTVELPAEHGPDALKLTSCIFGALFDMAVAVTVMAVGCVLPSTTELGNGPRTMVCPSVSTAGGDGALWRGVGLAVSGTGLVAMV